MSKEDWEIYHLALQEENPDINDNAHLIRKTRLFLKNFALPILQHQPPLLGSPTQKIIKKIWLPERHFDELGCTNLDILQRFASLKRAPPTHIIQRYIIDPIIRDEEVKLLKRL